MSWTLFPKETAKPSETARYRIEHQGGNAWFDEGHATKTPWIKGYANYKATRDALKSSGRVVVGVEQRGR
jgi:hypothetical protein